MKWSRGWIAITHDQRIRYKPNELAAVVKYNVSLPVVIGDAPYRELARSFVATLSRILAFLDEHRPPLIGKVYRPSPSEVTKNPQASGRIELWYPKR